MTDNAPRIRLLIDVRATDRLEASRVAEALAVLVDDELAGCEISITTPQPPAWLIRVSSLDRGEPRTFWSGMFDRDTQTLAHVIDAFRVDAPAAANAQTRGDQAAAGEVRRPASGSPARRIIERRAGADRRSGKDRRLGDGAT